uniref:LPS translocon maturation chaperone LptM n=1 Tax=Microbulbifer agarilyticus TaxID=260552 RepID=UPI0002558AA1|nr:lipoprotein [Microbulbifer agarilyticus]
MRTQLISLTAMVALSATLAACGQKGPLYLPQDPAAPGASGAAGAAGTGVTTSGGHSHGQPASSREEQRKPIGSAQQEQDTHQQHTEAEAVSK